MLGTSAILAITFGTLFGVAVISIVSVSIAMAVQNKTVKGVKKIKGARVILNGDEEHPVEIKGIEFDIPKENIGTQNFVYFTDKNFETFKVYKCDLIDNNPTEPISKKGPISFRAWNNDDTYSDFSGDLPKHTRIMYNRQEFETNTIILKSEYADTIEKIRLEESLASPNQETINSLINNANQLNDSIMRLQRVANDHMYIVDGTINVCNINEAFPTYINNIYSYFVFSEIDISLCQKCLLTIYGTYLFISPISVNSKVIYIEGRVDRLTILTYLLDENSTLEKVIITKNSDKELLFGENADKWEYDNNEGAFIRKS